MSKSSMTPAKALRMLIDIERRERARAERWARLKVKFSAVFSWLLNHPFARKERG